jgi:plastocyanin
MLAVVSLAAVASCSSGGGNSSPTGPGPGTGGGGPELNSGDFGPGGTYQHRFATAGTFNYHCIHHFAMRGSVLVTDAATDSLVNVSITTDVAAFPGASVKPGGRVIWTNNDNMVHTVTSD